ncbi:alanine racemase [Bacillus massiliglaciei]|uniref:alanine racemase n=1 Tax=Bacillus massiliglaciei TaxID=1816693 RepID=UPI000AB76237|nr:alanine racemase [Bacillus massiliglaciei]
MDTQGYHRDTWAEVDLDRIRSNVAAMRSRMPAHMKMYAVVKANAYGHGDYETARTALDAGADSLCVAFLDEALSLRKKGIKVPILVLGASRPEDAGLAAEEGISLTVSSRDWLMRAKGHLSAGQALPVQVKCDTGMGRLGVRRPEELAEIEAELRQSDCFFFEGIFTHFATADELNTGYYEKQLSRFKELLASLSERPPLVHSANSAASLRFLDPDFNAIRYGISMYGLSPSPEIKPELPFELKQALSLKTKIVFVKQLEAGESVSYGAVYTASGKEWVATLPIGYADGWIRKLQGQEVLVNGIRVPIIGRVCMDQCMIRLPEYIEEGTEVTLIGEDGGKQITVDEIAKRLETINYEVTCMISSRVPRVYIEGGKRVRVTNPLGK